MVVHASLMLCTFAAIPATGDSRPASVPNCAAIPSTVPVLELIASSIALVSYPAAICSAVGSNGCTCVVGYAAVLLAIALFTTAAVDEIAPDATS